MKNHLIPLFERYHGIIERSALQDFPTVDKCGRDHLLNLCAIAIGGIKTNSMPYGKLCRWLGFIQGILCSSGLISVDEERNLTRPIFKGEV